MLLPQGPEAAGGEAAFAASGTCIASRGEALFVGSSGPARLHMRSERDGAWRSADTGMSRNKPEAGVFSVAAVGEGVIAVGGDYTAEAAPGNAILWNMTDDAGALQVLPPPPGYRSGVACAGPTNICVAVGPTGADAWQGSAWIPISEVGYDAVDLAGNSGWASGEKGRIARVSIGD